MLSSASRTSPNARPTVPHRIVRVAAVAALALLAACTAHETAGVPGQVVNANDARASNRPGETFEATAYSIEGKTASGKHAREGICAADPDVLPLGSRIRVHDAGAYSGECEIADTGRAIKGREIDIYLANDREAKRFGRKKVRVEVLSAAR